MACSSSGDSATWEDKNAAQTYTQFLPIEVRPLFKTEHLYLSQTLRFDFDASES